jgi:hypothetical protein
MTQDDLGEQGRQGQDEEQRQERDQQSLAGPSVNREP